jgi:Signal transduction histidine kinase
MKYKEITHRSVEKIMFWTFLFFFPLVALFCFLCAMPSWLWGMMAAMPVIVGICTFVPFLSGGIQAYTATACMVAAATAYMWHNNTISAGHGVFLVIMCFAALYRRVGLTVLQIVYVTVLYAALYLLYPDRYFAHLEMPLSAVVRLAIFYMGSAAVIAMIVWFRNAVRIMESRAQSITELYKMVEKEKINAEAGSREKADFLANMSHEMRTPMIAVCGMSELLLQGNLSPLEEEYVTTIQNSAQNLLSMVNDILDFSKIEANKMQLEEAPYNVEELVSDVANIINVRLGEKDIAFLVDIAPDIPAELIGDEARLRQILINLLNNAVKFTEKGMIRLRMTCSVDENAVFWLKMDISDTGIGISREDQKKIFTQFTQVDADHSRRLEGTGLGLVISQRLANRMNGTISVESELGKGSTFTVVVEQKVKRRRELGFAPDPDGYVAYICEPDSYYAENLEKIIEGIGVAVIHVGDIAVWDYYNADRFGAVLFFDYASGIAGVNSFAPKIKRMRLVALAGRNTFVDNGVKENILIMRRPILTGQIASLIRGDASEGIRRTGRNENHLFIPDARILVVDDNYVNLRVTAGLLNVYKPRVEMVSDGREAFDLLMRDPHFDMIFMDHMMPGWDGIETVRHIRSLDGDYYRQVPIIALSANVGEAARELFLSCGMNDFVEKPMSTETLAAVIRKYIPPEKQKTEYSEAVDPMMKVSRPRREYLASSASSDKESVSIPGLNVPQGIFNMGGSIDAFHHILNVFLADGRRKVPLFRRYAAEGTVRSYLIEAHSLKSVAASIGAEELSRLAGVHEAAAKQGDATFITEHYEELAGQYDKLLDDVEHYLKSNGLVEKSGEDPADDAGKQPISAQKKRSSAMDIIRLIDRFDSDGAVAGINELLAFNLPIEDREALHTALDRLNDYDFDGALIAMRHFQ